MADLENNLEQAIAEGMQPDTKAEKGDSKPVKQGSSDAASIEGGKGEVVKPEENPVDKAIASVKSAEKGTKEVSGDAQQKGESPAEKQVKLKKVKEDSNEDAPVSKMESIKAIVNNMKEMTKEEITSILGTVSEEEIDETLTKAECARKVVESLKAMDEEEVADVKDKMKAKKDDDEEEDEVDEGKLPPALQKAIDKKNGKKDDEDEVEEGKMPPWLKGKKKGDDDEDEDEDVKESASIESSLIEIGIDDDLSAISEALELSEENAKKAKTIFKAAVTSKVAEVTESLNVQYSTNFKTSVEEVKGDLAEAVDKYLSYCAEEWTKENELAIERGLRSEMTEGFINGLKTLFTEHYVEVPEDKYNVIDELANRLDEMEQKLDGEVSRNMDITEELDTLKRSNVVREAGNSLSESQKEKLESLSNGIDFKDAEDFGSKVLEIKEAYFPTDVDSIVEETLVMEGTGTYEDESSETVLDPTIARYSSAISKLKPLG